MPLTRTTTPTDTDIIALADLKDYLRVTHDDEDTEITQMFATAREMCESYTGVYLSSDSGTVQTFDALPDNGIIKLLANPVTAVASVKYRDSNNVQQTLTENTHYYLSLSSRPAKIEVFNAPAYKERIDAWEVTYTSGYAEANTPKPLLQAIESICAALYKHRGDGKTRNKLIEDFAFDPRALQLLGQVRMSM